VLLDDDPVEVGDPIRPVLDARSDSTEAVRLLAAPFHTGVAFDKGRHLPRRPEDLRADVGPSVPVASAFSKAGAGDMARVRP
jgi:hypothetical protein